MVDSQVYAITEVFYIINHMADFYISKIPKEFYNFLESNYSHMLYRELNIDNDNIDNISYEGKMLLKIVSFYLN